MWRCRGQTRSGPVAESGDEDVVDAVAVAVVAGQCGTDEVQVAADDARLAGPGDGLDERAHPLELGQPHVERCRQLREVRVRDDAEALDPNRLHDAALTSRLAHLDTPEVFARERTRDENGDRLPGEARAEEAVVAAGSAMPPRAPAAGRRRATSECACIPLQLLEPASAQTGSSCRRSTPGASPVASSTISRRYPDATAGRCCRGRGSSCGRESWAL